MIMKLCKVRESIHPAIVGNYAPLIRTKNTHSIVFTTSVRDQFSYCQSGPGVDHHVCRNRRERF